MHRKISGVLGLVLMVLLACNLPSPKSASVEKNTTEPVEETVTVEVTEHSELPTETAEPTPPPVADSLNPNPPYLLFSGNSGIWISNPDGGFLTQLSEVEISTKNLRNMVSPNYDNLALVVDTGEAVELRLVSIPDGVSKTIAQLSDMSGITAEMSAEETKAAATLSILYYDAVAWQPGEGRYLAFVGAIDGETSDLYVYDTQTDAIRRLTSGPSHAIFPIWSPDGKYIYHFGVSWVPPFGGALIGYNRMDGAWAVRIADDEVLDQPKPINSHYVFVGWQDDSHYIIFDQDEVCHSMNLRSVDVGTGKATSLMSYSFYYSPALSSKSGAMMFAGSDDCVTSVGEGLFYLAPGASEPVKISDVIAYEVYWLPESGVFWAYPEGLYSSDGSKRYDPPVSDASFDPAVSLKGYMAWNVIENRVGRVEFKIPEGNWQTLVSGFFIGKLIWDPVNGDTLVIAAEDGTIYNATYPEFIPVKLGSIGGNITQLIWLP